MTTDNSSKLPDALIPVCVKLSKVIRNEVLSRVPWLVGINETQEVKKGNSLDHGSPCFTEIQDTALLQRLSCLVTRSALGIHCSLCQSSSYSTSLPSASAVLDTAK